MKFLNFKINHHHSADCDCDNKTKAELAKIAKKKAEVRAKHDLLQRFAREDTSNGD